MNIYDDIETPSGETLGDLERRAAEIKAGLTEQEWSEVGARAVLLHIPRYKASEGWGGAVLAALFIAGLSVLLL